MVHAFQDSFNAGELSPLLSSRSGVEKYRSGCRRLRNMVVSVHGPVSKRAGLEYLGPADTNEISPRLMGLNFSSTTSFVLEWTHGKICFWSNGVLVPFTLEHPYSDTEIHQLQTAEVNDVIYISHPNHVPRVLERFGDQDWRLREIHQPKTGWTTPTNSTPSTGNAVMERWFPAPNIIVTNLAATVYCAVNPPVQILPESGAPVGTGNNWPASIHRVRGWFVAPSSGVYKFRAESIDNRATVRFNSTAYDSSLGASVIIEAADNGVTPGTVDSANFNLVAGSAYWMEFLLNDFGRPCSGAFRFFVGGVDQGLIQKKHLAAFLNGQTGTTLDGWPALLDENVTPTTITPSGVGGNITLTASSDTFLPGHVGAWWQIAHRRENSYLEIVSAVSPAAATDSGASGMRVIGSYSVYTYGTWTGTLYLEELNADGSTWSVIRTWRSKNDRNVIDTGGTAEREATLRLRVSAITWTVQPRFLLEANDSKVYGLARITGFTSETVVNATVYSAIHNLEATSLWTEGAWSAVQGYPRCVCLHVQRVYYGSTFKRPQQIWATVVGDLENFRRSTFDDGGFSRLIASDKSFMIQWMISHGDLVIGTSLDEWVAATPQNQPITPASLDFRRQSANGSDYRQALLIRETIVFGRRNSNALSRLVYRDSGKYGASDITILASHLFAGGIRQMAWQDSPSSILWIILTNGRLVGLTYEEDQNVFACHEHTTDGEFKSVAVIHGPQGDEVWFCVKRQRPALTYEGDLIMFDGDPLTFGPPEHFIERFEPSTLFAGGIGTTAARRCYVDAATLRERATEFSTITGLGHLVGKTVSIFADGAQQPNQLLTSSTLTLTTPAKVACIGLPFVSEVQPMKLDIPLQDGTSRGRAFKLNRVNLILQESLGGSVAESPEGRKEKIQYRNVEFPMDVAPPLFSGEKEIIMEGSSRSALDVIITHDEPLPFTISGLVAVVDVFG